MGVRETSLPHRAIGHDDAAKRESERRYERRRGVTPVEQSDAGRLIAEDKHLEAKPDSITAPSDRSPGKLSGDVRTRWAWTEPSVWSKPMLATLEEQSVRGGKWSLQAIIVDVNRTLRGWFEYFKHSWRTTFPDLDGWVRMRLRSILRKRSGRRGRGHGLDHHRYPNAYFAEHGLFSLEHAHARESQPCLK